ncbi:MAG: HAD family hydrolase [Rhodomicrobium sp.]
MAGENVSPVDWSSIDLVVFDVDGTLYDQRSLRLRMMRDMLLHSAREGSLRFISVLRTYRRIRERLGDEEASDFEQTLIAETASRVGCSKEFVRSAVVEWIDRRPLRYLPACRYRGLRELFAGLKQSGKTVGILSDYPVHNKVLALGLDAEVIVSAGDTEVNRLKPHPKGLEVLIARAGATAARTILIGDRIERDGFAARRAGAKCLIRSRKPKEGWVTFDRYDAPLFAPFLTRS